jgi:ABC-2 type transport system permease protein
MRPFWLTAIYGFRMYFRDRTSVFWGIIFPLILMGLIGLAFGRTESISYTVGFVDQGGGLLARGVRQGLSQVPIFKVVDESNDTEAVAALRAGKRVLVVVVPAVAAGGEIRVIFDQTRIQDSQVALTILQRFVAEANLQLAGVTPVVRLHPQGIAGPRAVKFFDFLLPGILAMTVMQTGLVGVTEVLTILRQRLILKRILATPVLPVVFLSGLTARYAATILVQLAIIIAVAVSVFHATIVGSLVRLAGLAIFGTLVAVAIGFAISTLAATPESASMLGSVVHFPMVFLSGTFWPREFMPAFMQPVISALPLTPLIDAMRGVATRGDPLGSYLPGLAYLGLWGLVAFGVTAWRFRWE